MPAYAAEHLLVALLSDGGAAVAPPPDLDAPAFAALCKKHRVTGIALAAMKRHGVWPPPLIAALEETARKTLLDNIVLIKALKDTGALLDGAGIPYVVLKGASLLGLLYADPRHRPMSDLDILIREEDWPRLSARLGERGYTLPPREREAFYAETWYHQLVATPLEPRTFIEVHWNLESDERSRIDTLPLMERAVPASLDGFSFRRLADADLLLHLAVHLAHHYDDPSLHWVEDIRRLVRRGGFDWNEVMDRARAWSVVNPLAYALTWVERLAPGTLPAEARALRLSHDRRLLLALLGTGDPTLPHRALTGSPLRHVISMLLLDRWSNAARYIAVHSAGRLRRAVR